MFAKKSIKVRHYGKPMSKFDMAYEIDRIHYSYMGLSLETYSYDELRRKLYLVVTRYCPHRMIEFSNLCY